MLRVPFDSAFLVGYAFLFGAAVGSFANVCIYRIPRQRRNRSDLGLVDADLLPEGHSIVRPRSFCPGCRKPIPWHDNIPLLSYAILNGRCRTCRTRIPLRYPFVEFLTGALFALCAWRHVSDPQAFSLPVALVAMGVSAALVILAFIDLDFRIIPDGLSVGGVLLAVPLSLLVPPLHVKLWPPWAFQPVSGPMEALAASLAGILAGAGSIYAMHLMGVGYLRIKALLRSQRFDPDQAVVGGGDLKMMAAVGGILGWQGAVLIVFLLAPVFGALVGIAYRLITHDEYIAYGPFLALGTLIVMLMRREILELLGQAFAGRAVIPI